MGKKRKASYSVKIGHENLEDHSSPGYQSMSEDDLEGPATERRRRKLRSKGKYQSKVIFADRPAYQKRSNNLISESWSFHSLFPSMRTWIPLLSLPVSSWILWIAGISIGPSTWAALGSLFTIAVIIALIFFCLELTKARVSHAVKDFLIHFSVLSLLFLFFGAIESTFNVFLLYIGGHFMAHAVDFHLERSKNRLMLLIFFAGLLVFFELLLAVAYFEQSMGTF